MLDGRIEIPGPWLILLVPLNILGNCELLADTVGIVMLPSASLPPPPPPPRLCKKTTRGEAPRSSSSGDHVTPLPWGQGTASQKSSKQPDLLEAETCKERIQAARLNPSEARWRHVKRPFSHWGAWASAQLQKDRSSSKDRSLLCQHQSGSLWCPYLTHDLAQKV